MVSAGGILKGYVVILVINIVVIFMLAVVADMTQSATFSQMFNAVYTLLVVQVMLPVAVTVVTLTLTVNMIMPLLFALLNFIAQPIADFLNFTYTNLTWTPLESDKVVTSIATLLSALKDFLLPTIAETTT